MNTRRYPRTMDEAFGPYHRSGGCPIEPMPEPRSPLSEAGHTVAVVLGLVLIAALPVFCFLN